VAFTVRARASGEGRQEQVSDAAVPPIGQRLREARVGRGMTVRGLARAVDLSPSLISQIENGKSSPSVSTLYAITTALQISIEDVFGEPAAARPAVAQGGPLAAAALTPPPAVAGLVGGAATATDLRVGGQRRPALATADDAVVAADDAVAADGIAIAGIAADAAQPADTPALGGTSVVHEGLRLLANQRPVGPVVRAGQREVLQLDSGVTWELLGKLPHTHVDFLRITYAPGGSSSGAGVLMRHSGTEYGHVLSGRLTLNLGFDTYELNPGDSVSFDCSTPHAYANHGIEPAVGVWWVLERFG
jgi:DNA-binding XRE family transcriptional regulator/quercetin dioxygenase-like cupin family protein